MILEVISKHNYFGIHFTFFFNFQIIIKQIVTNNFWTSLITNRIELYAAKLLLNFFISKAPNNLFYHIENFNDLLSDHSAVRLTLNSSSPIQNNNPPLVNKNH